MTEPSATDFKLGPSGSGAGACPSSPSHSFAPLLSVLLPAESPVPVGFSADRSGQNGRSLGTTRDKGFGLSQTEVAGLVRRAEGRRSAAQVRRFHKQFHAGSRWAKCGTVRRSASVAIQRTDLNRAIVSGVVTCGSQAACIACGSKIRAKRCQEVQTGMRNLLKSGGSAVFATFTIPHYVNDRLEDLWPLLSKCWKYVITGSVWQNFKKTHGFMGYVSATEVTFGKNGAHPHKHQLFCFDHQIDGDSTEFDTIRRLLTDRWKRAVRKFLGRTVSETVGVDIRLAKDAEGLGEYLSKIGAELCLSSHKEGRRGSRTPWQVIADGFATGNVDDLNLFAEWCRVSKGKKLIQWSAGLRDRLLTDTEKTDEEIANETVDATTEAYLSGDIWDELNRRYDGAAGDFLTCWEQTHPDQAVNAGRTFLAAHGIQTRITRTSTGDLFLCRTNGGAS